MGHSKKCLDGLWEGLFDVVEATGQSPIPTYEWPWYTTLALRLHRRFRSIRESAAYDQDGMAPPKTVWLDNKQLKQWFDQRREVRKGQRRK